MVQGFGLVWHTSRFVRVRVFDLGVGLYEVLEDLWCFIGVDERSNRVLLGPTWRIMGLSKYGYKYPKWGYK